MAGDKDAKTEPPTPRRRSEARKSGQVPKSQDLSAAVLLLAGLVLLWFLGPGIWTRLLALYRAALAGEDAADSGRLIPFATASAIEVFKMVAPFMGFLVLAAGHVRPGGAALDAQADHAQPQEAQPHLGHCPDVLSPLGGDVGA
jgi:flagellar biosynthesis protein FlhB